MFNSLGKRILLGLGILGVIAAVLGVLINTIGYEPFGVPKALRPQFKAKIAKVKRQAEIIQSLDELHAPLAVVDHGSFDFGLLDPNSTSSHDFVVTNKGNGPLSLEVLETTCKCTVGKIEDDFLEPGESTTVTLTWTTSDQSDEFEQIAILLTNDPTKETFRLTVTGQVRAALVVPETLDVGTTDPGESVVASFNVYSQLWDEFYLESAECDLPGFDWWTEPIASDVPALEDADAKCAWKVSVSATGIRRGQLHEDVQLTFRSATTDEAVERTVAASLRVRAPINFYSPQIHSSKGLEIGTLVSGEAHEFPMIVRARGQRDKTIEVLDVQPEQLQATLTPLARAGEYRLVLTIPEDCPSVMFNSEQQHGYVEVGDPADEDFRNWFPVFGAVAVFE